MSWWTWHAMNWIGSAVNALVTKEEGYTSSFKINNIEYTATVDQEVLFIKRKDLRKWPSWEQPPGDEHGRKLET